MKRLLLGASAVIALSAGYAVRADDDYHFHDRDKNLTISYVRNSLAQSVILNGPWTLHESVANFIHDASGIVPPAAQTAPPYTGTGTPYASYCNAAGKLAVNHGFSLMQPYYFPFVRRHGDILEGFFDYRPRNEQEAVVAAISTDWGASWIFKGEALALNPYCPWFPSDPDNQFVSVNGVKTAYGSDPNSAADNPASPTERVERRQATEIPWAPH